MPAAGQAKLTNWCGAKDAAGNYVKRPCSTGASAWKAVACTNGRVTRVDLPGAGVRGSNGLGGGSIPTQLGELTGLTVLHLSTNSLSGSIPIQLGELTGLTYLSLHTNSLTGPIPASFCSLQPSITLRVFSNPGLTCYPSCLASYSVFIDKKGSLSAVCGGTPTCCAYSDVFFRC